MDIRSLLTICCLVLAPSMLCATEPLHIGKFSTGDLSGWTDKVFKGRTTYRLVSEDNHLVLKAHSVKSASGLIKKVNVDPIRFPILRWSWKVVNILPKEDITQKSGDDFSARVYVVFPSIFFWRTKAISYVWSSKMPKGSFAPNPYTGNDMVVAVESGTEKLDRWINEERNIFEDYRKLFGEAPSQIGAVAIMTDTDDTQGEATAFYGDIFLYPK